MRKSALAMLAINETPVFQVAQSQAYGDPADAKSPAKLMFAGDWKSALFGALKNFFRQRGDNAGACSRASLGWHSSII
jgi:hypothetical protein